jgi:L-ascorbate metabolism protein UlaG (beta-lactamase superfamily)
MAIGLVVMSGCLWAHPAPAPQLAHPVAVDSPPSLGTDEISVTWIGHSTALIGIAGHWFLTDPVFGNRIGHVLPRYVAPGIDPRKLPPIDAVLISHAHFDHLDLPSLRSVAPSNLIVPPGAARYVRGVPEQSLVALRVGESWKHGDVTITAVPAHHGDGRYLLDRWVHDSHTGYVIEVGHHSVYFAGDTGYSAPDAHDLRRFHIDVALIPVGPAGRNRWVEKLRADVHVTPDGAMTLFEQCAAQWMVPIHYGTFFKHMSDELPAVTRAITAHHLEARVKLLGIGETAAFLY